MGTLEMQWVHLKCNNIDNHTYRTLKSCNEPWHCISCFIPYSNLTDTQLKLTLSKPSATPENTAKIKCPQSFKSLFKDLNDVSNSVIDCKYYDINEFNKSQSNDHMSYIHLNIASLPSHIDDLRVFHDSLHNTPAVIGISESFGRNNY